MAVVRTGTSGPLALELLLGISKIYINKKYFGITQLNFNGNLKIFHETIFFEKLLILVNMIN